MPDMQSYGSTMQKITRSDQIESARIRELFAYWQDKRRGDLLPRRADIDPVEIPRLMPYVLIADIEHAPFRVRFRLVGTKVVEATGFEFTGKYLDEITLPDDEGPVLESYQLASESKCAVLTRMKRSEEHTSELQSLMRTSYAVFCLTQKTTKQ